MSKNKHGGRRDGAGRPEMEGERVVVKYGPDELKLFAWMKARKGYASTASAARSVAQFALANRQLLNDAVDGQ